MSSEPPRESCWIASRRGSKSLSALDASYTRPRPRVERDGGAEEDLTVLGECRAYRGPAKVAQKSS